MRSWKQAGLISAVVVLLALASAVAMAADQPTAGQAQGGPHMGPGPHGRGAGGQTGRGQAGGRFGTPTPHGIAPGRGYIEPNAETKALWEKLGKIEADLHAAQWDLFVLMAQKPRDQQKINAQQQKIKRLRDEMRGVWEKLKPYWHPAEAQAAGRTGRGGTRTSQHAAPGGTRTGQQAAPAGKGGK